MRSKTIRQVARTRVYCLTMRHTTRALIVALFISTTVHAQQKIAIFIGPQTRDGFIDMDAGIRDSIRDIQQECQQGAFTIASSADKATLVLIVIGRGMPVKGDVGFGSSVSGIGYGFVVPNSVPTITTSLRVGKYERTTSREGGTWRNAAKMVAEDLTAWVEANREAIAR
jgi:hypothetical protein